MLVHADGAGRDATADVADAQHLEQALDGAVLAEGAVQECERDVDVAEIGELLAVYGGHSRAVLRDHPDRPLRGFFHFGRDAVDNLVVAEHVERDLGPCAAPGDADADDLVAALVDGVEHTRRREA